MMNWPRDLASLCRIIATTSTTGTTIHHLSSASMSEAPVLADHFGLPEATTCRSIGEASGDPCPSYHPSDPHIAGTGSSDFKPLHTEAKRQSWVVFIATKDLVVLLQPLRTGIWTAHHWSTISKLFADSPNISNNYLHPELFGSFWSFKLLCTAKRHSRCHAAAPREPDYPCRQDTTTTTNTTNILFCAFCALWLWKVCAMSRRCMKVCPKELMVQFVKIQVPKTIQNLWFPGSPLSHGL